MEEALNAGRTHLSFEAELGVVTAGGRLAVEVDAGSAAVAGFAVVAAAVICKGCSDHSATSATNSLDCMGHSCEAEKEVVASG